MMQRTIQVEVNVSTALASDDAGNTYRTYRKKDDKGEYVDEGLALVRRAVEGLCKKLEWPATILGVGSLPDGTLAVIVEGPDVTPPA